MRSREIYRFGLAMFKPAKILSRQTYFATMPNINFNVSLHGAPHSSAHLEYFRDERGFYNNPLFPPHRMESDLKKIETVANDCDCDKAIKLVSKLITDLESKVILVEKRDVMPFKNFLKTAYNLKDVCHMRNPASESTILSEQSFKNALEIDSEYSEAKRNLDEFRYVYGIKLTKL